MTVLAQSEARGHAQNAPGRSSYSARRSDNWAADEKPFEENTGIYDKDVRPLFERQPDYARLSDLIQRFSLSV